MNKKIVWVGIIGLIAIVWFIFQGSTRDYVATVDDEVSKLEAELAEINNAVDTGALTSESAAAAQEKVISRLGTINSSISSSYDSNLSDSQRVMLLAGLERLKNVLLNYQETLLVVDEAASESTGSKESQLALPSVLTETIETVKNYVDEAVFQNVPQENNGTTGTTTNNTASTTETGGGSNNATSSDESIPQNTQPDSSAQASSTVNS